jgi:hypothetical protein
MVIRIQFLEVFFAFFILLSCQTQTAPRKSFEGPAQSIEHKNEAQIKDKGMSNPIMLSAAGGADIGRLFNAYYRVGQQNNMYPFIDSQTKKKFSKEKILQLLTQLDFGYDIRLSGATNNNPNYVLTYTCQIAQTKVIKQLKVVVENDTARIIPSNLLQGKIFQ